MSYISNRKREFSRMAGGYDPQEVGDYIINMQSQLRGSEQQSELRGRQQTAETAPARAPEPKRRMRRLRPVPSTGEETQTWDSLADDTRPEEPSTVSQPHSPLDELTTERDRLMSEISNLMSDLNSIERRRAAMLGASMADAAKR